jgi:hypothetical protein
MPITEQLRSVARFEAGVLRSALTTVDRAVLTPLADRSPGLGRVVTRARGAFSDLSGRLGGSASGPLEAPAPVAAEPEAAPPIEVPKDEPKDEPKNDAAEARQEPDTSVEPVEGSAVLDNTEVAEVEALAEEFLEEEAVHVTGELAENEDLREVQARLRAKHALQEQDEQHR